MTTYIKINKTIKDLDLPYKTDLDFWIVLEEKQTHITEEIWYNFLGKQAFIINSSADHSAGREYPGSNTSCHLICHSAHRCTDNSDYDSCRNRKPQPAAWCCWGCNIYNCWGNLTRCPGICASSCLIFISGKL